MDLHLNFNVRVLKCIISTLYEHSLKFSGCEVQYKHKANHKSIKLT